MNESGMYSCNEMDPVCDTVQCEQDMGKLPFNLCKQILMFKDFKTDAV